MFSKVYNCLNKIILSFTKLHYKKQENDIYMNMNNYNFHKYNYDSKYSRFNNNLKFNKIKYKHKVKIIFY